MLRAALETAAPGCVRSDVPLTELGRWRIGGPADLVVEPRSVTAMRRVAGLLAESGVRWTLIGGGSNILFDSAGYRGVIVRIGRGLSSCRVDRESGIVEAEAGLWAPAFVLGTLRAGLEGCVHAIGIPGTLGGLVAMNGGSRRRGIGEQLIDLEAVMPSGQILRFDRTACDFAYRRSVFQRNGAVIVSARFGYRRADPAALRREAIEIMVERRGKFPRAEPNCGSVFVSDPALYKTLGPPGAAIEAVGLKGERRGRARISPRHANFIVNEGGARSEDVLALVGLARQRVFDRTGIAMHSEVLHLPPEGGPRPAHMSAPVPVADEASSL